MATVTIKLNHKATLKGSTRRSIVLSVTHQRKYFYITLDCPAVEPEHLICYENGNAEISAKAKYYPNRTWHNNFLLAEKQKVEDIINTLREKNTLENLSIKELNLQIRSYHKPVVISFYDFFQNCIEEKYKLNSANTARCMADVLSCFKKFSPKLEFEDIDYKFLKSFEIWYLQDGRKINGLSVKLRALRIVVNRAIKEGIMPSEKYPFKHYKIKSEKTVKRALPQDVLQKIINYTPSCNSEQLAKDIFLFSFYCAGINFKDMALLTSKNVTDGRLKYNRGKTGDYFSYKLNTECLEILHRYESENKYLIPIILQENLTGKDLLNHILNRHSRINNYMKQIGKKLNLSIPLTSYVARHSFATIAKKKNIPIAVISELLGHEDIKTTQIYLDSLETESLDKYLTEITEF